MDLQIVTTKMIKPSIPTPHHLKNFNFSFLDQIIPPYYIPLTLFYNTKFDISNISEILDKLKKSLSDTLTIFYPLAGRIKNPISVHCNDEGVSYTEATATCTLSEFLKAPHLNSLNKFLPLDATVLQKNGEQLLMSLQVTILEGGGLVIGVCLFHRVGDLATLASFLRTWADLFDRKGDREVKIVHQDLAHRGSTLYPPLSSFPDDYELNSANFFFSEGNGSITRRFVFDASSIATLRAKATSENVPNPSRVETLTGNANFFFSEGNGSITRRFVFDASSIATLRAKATSENVPNPSRVETLTGFITQRLMAGLESRNVMIIQVVNIRRRLDPSLPDNAFGNLLWFLAAFYTPSESKMELSECVETLREVLQGLNDENLRELDPEEAIQAMNKYQGEISRGDVVFKVLKFTSWCNKGLYDVDFGWGKPAWVAYMGDAAHDGRAKHHFMFLEGKICGEIELWALLDEHDMAILENDEEFTAFAAPNPSIPLEF